MKKAIHSLLLISIFIGITGCGHKNAGDKIFDKAVIYYNPNTAPWGLMKIIDVSVVDFLQDSINLGELVVTNNDSLQYISGIINKTTLTPLAINDYVDTSIAVLLFSQGCIDTLATNAYPHSPIQYNNMTFEDSTLVYHLINIIREHEPLWDNEAKDYYYDGTYNPLPKSIFD
jgi:lipoprotein